MINVKNHYDNHLADFYSWMAGDFSTMQKAQQEFLEAHGIEPALTGFALDLGAGHGLQSVSLAKIGFSVIAVDFSSRLLAELEQNKHGLNVQVVEDDIMNVARYGDVRPELIICAGDTIAHLGSKEDVKRLIEDCRKTLVSKGKLVLTFRDYSNMLQGNSRFIPVKADDNRILTCFLEYSEEKVRVTDLLYEKKDGKWVQKISSYDKVRVWQEMIVKIVEEADFSLLYTEQAKGMVTVIAVNP